MDNWRRVLEGVLVRRLSIGSQDLEFKARVPLLIFTRRCPSGHNRLLPPARTHNPSANMEGGLRRRGLPNVSSSDVSGVKRPLPPKPFTTITTPAQRSSPDFTIGI
ncbi:hypothetical protein QCA50_001622 [Cerrena zonata]|uniref:Uncharacterized protein n=1 Tax=Cerrena zonata TaxID=2478898 RepID=A0AAW0GNW5_9APHY